MDLVKRMKATQKTVDKFKGRTFKDWSTDCILLAVTHARHMGAKVKMPKYTDAKSAAAVLKRMGVTTLGGALDKHFTRIEPHEAMLGDLVEVPGTNGFSSIMVAVGNGRAIGFHEEIPHADILQPVMISGAWRIGEGA